MHVCLSSPRSSLLALVLVLLVGGGLAPPAAGQLSAAPRRAPDFALEQMNGETFRLSDHDGEIVVLNFWATWCPPCRKEIPGFIALQEEFGDRGVTFVGVSMDEEGFSTVRPYAEKMGINYPIVVDDGSVARLFGGARVLPSTVLIGPKRKIQHRKVGFFPEERLRTRLEALLRKKGEEGR
jgi:cytochrome c biogenesis protein CcmG/thiol:disulfide interchange protein DsbE